MKIWHICRQPAPRAKKTIPRLLVGMLERLSMTEIRPPQLRPADHASSSQGTRGMVDAGRPARAPLIAGDPLARASDLPNGPTNGSGTGGASRAARKSAGSRLVSLSSLFRFGTPKGNPL